MAKTKKNRTLSELLAAGEERSILSGNKKSHNDKPYKVKGQKYTTVGSNNWMNIRHSANQTWQGEVGNADGFVLFSDPELSVRAFFRVLNSYAKQGADTIGKIVSKYAPAGDDNNTQGYIRDVVAAMRTSLSDKTISKDTKIDSSKFAAIASAMMKIESGQSKDIKWFQTIYNKYF